MIPDILVVMTVRVSHGCLVLGGFVAGNALASTVSALGTTGIRSDATLYSDAAGRLRGRVVSALEWPGTAVALVASAAVTVLGLTIAWLRRRPTA